MYLEIICLFVNDYLNSEQFEELFFNNIFEYEKILDNKAYLEVIDTNFDLSYKVISLKNYLKTYLITNYYNEINIINDSYVDMVVNSNRTDVVAEILKSHYTKREIVYINCDLISNQADLIRTIKDSLQFSEMLVTMHKEYFKCFTLEIEMRWILSSLLLGGLNINDENKNKAYN